MNNHVTHGIDQSKLYLPHLKEFINTKITNPSISVSIFLQSKEINDPLVIDAMNQYIHRHPRIMSFILNESRKRYHSQSLEIDRALSNKAIKGDPRAIELWYKRMENWNIQQESQGNQVVVIINNELIPMKDRTQSAIEIKAHPGKQEIIDDVDNLLISDDSNDSCTIPNR